MASINLAYIGGGSTRAPGTVAIYLLQADAFRGSTVTLIDQRPDTLELVKRLAERMAAAQGADICVRTTTDLETLRCLALAVAVDALPASYMNYYYYRDEVLKELQAKPTTRAQDIWRT